MAFTSLPIATADSALTGAEGVAALQKAHDMPSAADVNNSVKKSSARLLNKISTGSDAVILVGGDSTGDEDFEWVYKLAEWLNSEHPTYTVNYYLWDVGAKEFPTEATQSFAGSGSAVISLYNGSVGGSRNDYMLGERFNNFAYGKNADLVICNYGHNIAQNLTTESYIEDLYCMYLAFIASVIEANPSAGCMVIGQNPQRTNTKLSIVNSAAKRAAGNLNCDYIDAYTKFEELEKITILYLTADVVHPSEKGQTLILGAVLDKMTSGAEKPALNSLAQSNGNLIATSDAQFLAWDGAGLPNRFLRSGNTQLTKDFAVFESGKGFSVRIESSVAAAGNTFIQYTLDAGQLTDVLGKDILIAMRFRRPLTSTPVTSGKVEIFIDNSVRVETDEHNNLPIGAWSYRFISALIPLASTSVKLNFYADDSTNDAVVNIDAVACFAHEIPTNFTS
jgi:hypothetical protein